jgi:hypothetical protein
MNLTEMLNFILVLERRGNALLSYIQNENLYDILLFEMNNILQLDR